MTKAAAAMTHVLVFGLGFAFVSDHASGIEDECFVGRADGATAGTGRAGGAPGAGVSADEAANNGDTA